MKSPREAPAVLGPGLAGLAGLAAVALAFTLEDEALTNLTRAVLAGMGLIVLGALADPGARLRLFSFASAAFGVGLAVMLARTARRRPRVSLSAAALFVAVLAGLSAFAASLVLASRDLMIADFVTYRGIAIMVARLADAGNRRCSGRQLVGLITQDYSWSLRPPGRTLAPRRLPFASSPSAAGPLRAAGPPRADGPGARSRAARGTAPRALTPTPRRCISDLHHSCAHTLLREAGKVTRRADGDGKQGMLRCR